MPKISDTSSQNLSQPERCWIGIDPGLHGGLVALFSSGKILATAMPSTDREIWVWFNDLSDSSIVELACLERVHSMPNQSAQSGFTFGCGFGKIVMALCASSIPYETVTPQSWMKSLGIPSKKKTESKSQWKNRLLKMAQELFPKLPLWDKPKSKGEQLAIADALLIAYACRRLDSTK